MTFWRAGLLLAVLWAGMFCTPWRMYGLNSKSVKSFRPSLFDVGEGVQGFAISPDSQSVALYASTGSNRDEIVSEIQIWDWHTTKMLLRRVVSRRNSVDHSKYYKGGPFVRYADSGKKLVLCQEGNMLVLDSSTLQELKSIDLDLGPPSLRGSPGSSEYSKYLHVTDMEVSSNQRVAILLNYGPTGSGEIRVYDFMDGSLLKKWILTKSDQFSTKKDQPYEPYFQRAVSIDPDGNKITFASSAVQIDRKPLQSQEYTVRILDINSGEETRKIASSTLPIVARFVSSHPLIVATVYRGAPSYPLYSLLTKDPKPYVLSLWNAESGDLIRTISSTPGGIHDFLEISEDGRIALGYINYGKCGFFFPGMESGCAEYDNKFRLWDLTTGEVIATSPAMTRRLTTGFYFSSETDHVMLSPKGDLVVTGTIGLMERFKPFNFFQLQ